MCCLQIIYVNLKFDDDFFFTDGEFVLKNNMFAN